MFCKIILIIILILLLLVILPITHKEKFIGADLDSYIQNKPTSNNTTDIYKAEDKFLKNIYSDNFYGIDNDLLITNRCIKMKVNGNPDNFKEELANKLNNLPFPYIEHETFIYNNSDLETNIIYKIKQFYSKYNIEIINSPIYVLLFQAPYLRYIDDECKVHERSIQFNYYNKFNDLGYKIENKYNCNIPIDTRKTYVLMYILFPTYNKEGNFVYRNWENIKCNMSMLLNQFQHDKGCFVKCKDSNKACGCLNTDTPYKSRCTGDNDIFDKDLYNYGILYTVNNQSLTRLTDGNMSNGLNVNIKPYFESPLDIERCKVITEDPITIPNLI